VPNPSLKLLGHSRCSELCGDAGLGEEAYRHLLAALDALNHLSDQSPTTGLRRGLVLACLQRGEVAEAEEWQRRVERSRPPEQTSVLTNDMAAWAEIALARGLTELGLERWRLAVERVRASDSPHADPGMDAWARAIEAYAVVAHAYAGRLELVSSLVSALESRLRTLLADGFRPSRETPLSGTDVLALGLVRLAAGDASAVRLLALAQRLHLPQTFPTMSADRARRVAEETDRAAYAEAVSEYAALGRDELRDAARALTSGRG
jgi:hypothetical protein